VLNQDYNDFEILVGDDSTDNLIAEKIERFCEQNSILYFRNIPAKGPASNWNQLITRANGKLIKFLHHDDKFTRFDSLQKFVEAIDSQPNSSIVFSSSILTDRLDVVGFTNLSWKKCNRVNQSPSLLFSKNILGAPSACIFKKIDGLFFREDFRWLVDLEFYYKALRFGQVGCLEESLVDVSVCKVDRLTSSVENDGVLNMREHFELAKTFEVHHLHPRIFLRLAKVYLKFNTPAFWVLAKNIFREK
jgi:glycosyltransferase involved in cell wall biosynthesis